MLGVLDVLLQRDETVDLPGKLRGDGRDRGIAALGDFGRRPGRVGRDDRIEAERADQLAALRQRVNVAADRADR